MVPGFEPYASPAGFVPASGQQWIASGGPAAMHHTTIPTADDILKACQPGCTPVGGQAWNPSIGVPKFIFRPRVGKINWRLLHSLELDRVIREGDIDTIQAHMDNITYSHFGREDLQNTSDESLTKLVMLSQLCMEFLCSMCASSQQLTQNLVDKVRVQAAHVKVLEAKLLENQRQDPNCRKSSKGRSAGRHTSPARRRHSSSRDFDKRVSQAPTTAFKCIYCPKRFHAEHYLREHMQRRHRADMFAESAPAAGEGGPEQPTSSPPPTVVTQMPAAPQMLTPRKTPQVSPQARNGDVVLGSASGMVATTTEPHTAEEMTKVLRGIMQEEMQQAQRNFETALSQVRQDVQSVKTDMHRVSGDMEKIQPAATPVPAAPAGMPTESLQRLEGVVEGVVAKIDELQSRTEAAAKSAALAGASSNENLERRVLSLLEAKEREMQSRSETLPVGGGGGSSPRTIASRTVEAAKAAMKQEIQEQMHGFVREMETKMEARLQENAEQVAEQVREVAKSEKSTTAVGAWNMAGAGGPVVQDKAATSDGIRHKSERSDTAEAAASVPFMQRDSRDSMFTASSTRKAPARTGAPIDVVGQDPGAGIAPTAHLTTTATATTEQPPPGSTRPSASASFQGFRPELGPDAEDWGMVAGPATAAFDRHWKSGLSNLDQEKEQLRFMISMAQERTRPRRGQDEAGRPTEDDRANVADWGRTLQKADAKKAQKPPPAQEGKLPETPKKRTWFRRSPTPKKQKDEEKLPPKKAEEEQKTKLASAAFGSGLAGFLRCTTIGAAAAAAHEPYEDNVMDPAGASFLGAGREIDQTMISHAASSGLPASDASGPATLAPDRNRENLLSYERAREAPSSWREAEQSAPQGGPLGHERSFAEGLGASSATGLGLGPLAADRDQVMSVSSQHAPAQGFVQEGAPPGGSMPRAGAGLHGRQLPGAGIRGWEDVSQVPSTAQRAGDGREAQSSNADQIMDIDEDDIVEDLPRTAGGPSRTREDSPDVRGFATASRDEVRGFAATASRNMRNDGPRDHESSHSVQGAFFKPTAQEGFAGHDAGGIRGNQAMKQQASVELLSPVESSPVLSASGTGRLDTSNLPAGRGRVDPLAALEEMSPVESISRNFGAEESHISGRESSLLPANAVHQANPPRQAPPAIQTSSLDVSDVGPARAVTGGGWMGAPSNVQRPAPATNSLVGGAPSVQRASDADMVAALGLNDTGGIQPFSPESTTSMDSPPGRRNQAFQVGVASGNLNRGRPEGISAAPPPPARDLEDDIEEMDL